MTHQSTAKQVAVMFLVLCAALLSTSAAKDKPLLSEAIRNIIDAKGSEAAKMHFAELSQSQRDNFDVDMQGISQLTSTYMKSGNMAAASAVSEISVPFLQNMISKSLNQYTPGLSEQMAEKQHAETDRQARKREADTNPQERITNFQGEPRSDLKRFTGLYGDHEESDPNRRLWVRASCDGYLVSGAMWGDAAPWWLKPAGDKVFIYQDSFSKIKIEFETGADDTATGMRHDLEILKSPLERLGHLPDGYTLCMERPKR